MIPPHVHTNNWSFLRFADVYCVVEKLYPLLQSKTVREKFDHVVEVQKRISLSIRVTFSEGIEQVSIELAHFKMVFGNEALQRVYLQQLLDYLTDL